MLRAIPPDLDPEVVAGIDGRLERVEHDDGVRVLWAVESGSRAWGFPSPDSDYDGRFLYIRPRARYLALWPERDVIETPLDRIYDVNGWDLAKAVRLIVKGNATVTEWLRSPIVYRGDAAFRDGLLAFAEQVADRALLGRHHLHIGQQQWDAGSPSLKKVFYALRPAATLRWLRFNPHAAVPPMNLPELLMQCEPDAVVAHDIADLIALKAQTRELGSGTVPDSIRAFIVDELRRGEELYEDALSSDRTEARAAAQRYFEHALETFSP